MELEQQPNTDRILPIDITEEMQKSYLDYAMSVIVARALPDVKDGLKPVHRRILFACHEMNLTHAAKHQKCAKIVGETMGKYHPHGDLPIYDALVRLAQDFAMRYPLIDGQGNFGSVDGDPPAAMRYTEARLAAISAEMLQDIDKETVDFSPNFDGTLKEPNFLPGKLPNLLLMGSEGIAVGMATKIPPHNLSEVIDAITLLIEKGKAINKTESEGKNKTTTIQTYEQDYTFESEATVEDLMTKIQGPDFPTGAQIYDQKEIAAAYATGRGKIIIRGKAEIEEISNGKSAIIVTEIPYQVNKAQLVAKIAELVKDHKIEGISDLRDETDRHGTRVVIELKRDSKPRSVLNNLYKHTLLQTSFPVNMVALVNGTPQTLTLKLILEEYVRHRQRIVVNRSRFELKEAKARLHILEGLKIALDHLDAVIETIKKSKDAEEAKINLMSKFGLSEIQSVAILDMQLRRLAALERQKIEDEYQMVRETIAYLEDLLSHPEKILDVIKNEITYLKEKYGDPRKTRVFKGPVGEFAEEDLIAREETVITITKTGYVKRQGLASFRTQQRGGVGITGMTTKDEDAIDKILVANTHDNILFFTNKGKVYQLKAWDIPEGTRVSKGQAIVNLINIEQGESVKAILTYDEKRLREKGGTTNYIFLATKKGVVKKTALKEFENIRRSGILAIKLEESDELCWAKLTSGKDTIIIISREGKSIRFSEKEVRPMGRDTMGVRGILLKGQDLVISTDKISEEDQKKDLLLLVISEKGIGKKAPISDFPKQGRGGQGVKAAEITAKTGKLICAEIIPENAEAVILTSAKGQVVKLPITVVPKLGRATQGVILMRFPQNDSLAAATCIRKE